MASILDRIFVFKPRYRGVLMGIFISRFLGVFLALGFVGCTPSKMQKPDAQAKAIEIESQTLPGVDDILRAVKPGDLRIK